MSEVMHNPVCWSWCSAILKNNWYGEGWAPAISSNNPVGEGWTEQFIQVADFTGTQPAFEHLPAIDLWTLRVPLGKHPAGSTLSRETLIELLKT